MDCAKKNWFKYIIGWGIVFAIRLLPFRPPNMEPVLATAMPFAKKFGGWAGFFFAFLSIALYDAATGKTGTWTLITGAAYGIVAGGAYFYFKKRKPGAWNFLAYSVVGTLFFDIVTGLSIGPLFYGQPFMDALIGQIPFTAMHLLGNGILAFAISPYIYRWVAANPKLESAVLFGGTRSVDA